MGLKFLVIGERFNAREVNAYNRMKKFEKQRLAAKNRKQAADDAGDEAAWKTAHVEMGAASESLGETAADASMRHDFPSSRRPTSELPGKQKNGEFERIYVNGDEVYLVEAKGAGAGLGNRNTPHGLAQQGTRQYRDSIIANMRRQIEKGLNSNKYETNKSFKNKSMNFSRPSP